MRGIFEMSLAPLRFLTCGSVDDGKSTLIGRLLYERGLIFDDQLSALEKDLRKYGTTGGEIDFALLVDGLEAEREQGITIDVAYRYFATPRRAFIVADTPGHEQYTRNMATGASNSDLAVVLVDARKGLLAQTFRHSLIISLLGVRHVVLAVNKMDLVGYDQGTFDAIAGAYCEFARELGFETVEPIPISARYGENVTAGSASMPWYAGLPLLAYLEQRDVEEARAGAAFRLAVQGVCRPHLDFRGYAGTIAGGRLRVGDEVVVAKSGVASVVREIYVAGALASTAQDKDAVIVTLRDEVDIARGDVLCHPQSRPQVADQWVAHILWMSEEPMLPGRSYLLKMGTQTVPAQISVLKHRLDVHTREKLAAKTLRMNEIGLCNVSASAVVAFDPYRDNRQLGGFILIDRYTHETAAAGVIEHGLRRAGNVYPHAMTTKREARAAMKQQKAAIVWFTGLSGAGKSVIANAVEQKLFARGVHTIMLDGDNLRLGLNKDLGFTPEDRVENIRRVAEVARLMSDAGLIVLAAFISPFRADRALAREMACAGEFYEIFVDTPLAEVIQRDPKGLYRRALAGEIRNFTGVDQPYEPPETPDLRLDTVRYDAQSLAEQVVALLEKDGCILKV